MRFFGIPESSTESSPNWQEEDGRDQASDRSLLENVSWFLEKRVSWRVILMLMSTRISPRKSVKEEKKQWLKPKKARKEGKIAFFSKPEPEKLFADGQFVRL